MKGEIPKGYEDAVEEGPNGWAVWMCLPKLSSGRTPPPCPHEGCDEPYDQEEPAHALVCPSCQRPGCDHCMPNGRGCVCPECEDDADE